ncbi:recombinase RecT [Neorhizobium lilium]|nr:recombinase RecT [Neorhizobium lilium]
MNQVTQASKLGAQVAITGGDNGFAVTPQTLSDIVEFAKFMCQSNAGIPAYLRGNAPDCAAITMQALKWNFDPFSVAQKSYKVKDVLAYEAQLIAAVVNTRSGIKGRLKYSFEGEGAALTCTVTGILEGEEYAYTSPPVGSITTKNSPLWKTDPQQQLGYYSARSWARRYTPEVLLGVYDRDEAEDFRGPDKAKDVTPAFDPFSDDIYTPPQGQQDGGRTWTGDIAHEEPHDASTGEILTDNRSDAAVPPPGASDADDDLQTSASEAGSVPADPASTKLPTQLRNHLMDFARKASTIVEDDALTDEVKGKTIEDMLVNYRDVVPEPAWGKLSTIKVCMQAVFAGKRTIDQARTFIASDLLDCKVEEIGG